MTTPLKDTQEMKGKDGIGLDTGASHFYECRCGWSIYLDVTKDIEVRKAVQEHNILHSHSKKNGAHEQQLQWWKDRANELNDEVVRLKKEHIEPQKDEGEWDEKCKRCGRVYPVKGVYVCPCHPMFDKDYNWDGGYIQFSTPEDANKVLELLKKALSSQEEWIRKQVEAQAVRRTLETIIPFMTDNPKSPDFFQIRQKDWSKILHLLNYERTK